MILLMKCGILSFVLFVIFNGFLLGINGQTQDAQFCRLPNGTAGLCVPVTLCPNLQPLLTSGPSWSNSDLQYLKGTICGRLRVCCTQPINEDSTGGTAPAGNGVIRPNPPQQNNPIDFNPNRQVTRRPNRRTTRDLFNSEYYPISANSDFDFTRNPEKINTNNKNTRNKNRRKPVKNYQEDDEEEIKYLDSSAEEEIDHGIHHSYRKPASDKHFHASDIGIYQKPKHYGHLPHERLNPFGYNNDFIYPEEHSHEHHDIYFGRPKHHNTRDNQNNEYFHGDSKPDHSEDDLVNRRHHTSKEYSGGHNHNVHNFSNNRKPELGRPATSRPFENDYTTERTRDRSNESSERPFGRRPTTSKEHDEEEGSSRRTQGTSDRRRTGQVSGSSLLPRSDECGKQGLEDKIIGGNATGIDQYPWMVLIQYSDRNTGKKIFSCGGALISSRYILTAAHCLTGPVLTMIGQPVSVRLGDYDLSQKVDCVSISGREQDCNDGPVDIEIESVHPHESYHLRRKTDDIGLIRLRSPVPTGSDFIQPICLPDVDSTLQSGFDGKYMVAGWGATTVDGNNRSNVIKHIQVELEDYELCKRRYKNRYELDPLSLGRQFCAGGKRGQDTCSGDSGGPVMRKDAATDRITADGIISFGPRPCAEEGVPGIYTKVFAYKDWIEFNMRP